MSKRKCKTWTVRDRDGVSGVEGISKALLGVRFSSEGVTGEDRAEAGGS